MYEFIFVRFKLLQNLRQMHVWGFLSIVIGYIILLMSKVDEFILMYAVKKIEAGERKYIIKSLELGQIKEKGCYLYFHVYINT